MSKCLFCEIIAGTIPAKIVAQTESVIAFHDINPQAPVHILIVSKGHIEAVTKLLPDQAACVADMALMAQRLAKENGVEDCARMVFNNGTQAGQSVFHLHMHLLGGRDFSWPPG